MKTQEPPVQVQQPAIEQRTPQAEQAYDYDHDERFVWPKDKPLPTHYVKPRPLPCPKCRRVRFNNLGQAVVVISSPKDVAFFRCKACGHQFKMPVQNRN